MSTNEQTAAEGQFLTMSQTADLLNTSYWTVRRRIAAGELDAVRIGAAKNAPIRIASSDLVAYLQRVNGR